MSSNTVQSGVMTEIKQEQVTTLYRRTSLSFWGNLILIAIVSLMFFNVHNSDGSTNPYFIVWLASLVLLCFYRFHVCRQFNPGSYYEPGKIVLWANKYILITTIINTIWGASGIILLSSNLAEQALLALILFSVLLFSVSVLAISRLSFAIQVLAVLVPLLISLIATSTHQGQHLLAFGIAILATTLFVVSDYIHTMLIELRDTQASLSRQANSDALTQIANRRYFDQTFKNEWRRTLRDELPISMLLVDIDNFKQFNELQGERAGDKCLKAIASCMEVVTRRPGDLAARYSGEEFAVLLPNTTMENAVMLAEKLRSKVEMLQLPHPGSSYNVVTVSIGVSCCAPRTDAEKADDAEEEVMYPAMLMNAADNAMFLAKQQGQNRIAEQKCGEQRLAQVLQKYAAKEASRT
ncbi:GGDEF domain-containing protein [Leucothrix mucor]|uniref:GGDEF domain-containing protein n=1 Tax=Leucothrix mucor TaxID=45248 RepID=UPI00146CEF54|nr:GGDEF domain-containing protein [Leucothrix mucor]